MPLLLSKLCSMGGTKAGLVDTIGVTLLNSDGTVHTAKTTAGIYEIGGGCYGKEITFPDNWLGSIVWNTGYPAWLSGWSKRKAITLTGGSSGIQSDYQIKLTVPYDSDMRSDYCDIRFTESDGETLIDAWLESKTDNVTADIWVKFPDTPADDSTTTYYMYYGNPYVNDYWDGENTFPDFFDNFEDGDVSDWTSEAGSSVVAQNTTVKSGSYSLHHTAATDGKESYKACVAQTSDFIIDFDLHPDPASSDPSHLIFRVAKNALAGVGTDCLRLEADDDLRWSLYPNNGNFMAMANQWYAFELLVHPATDTVDVWVDGVSKVVAGDAFGDISTVNSIGFIQYYSAGKGLYADNIRIRNYTANPATYVIELEHSQTWLSGWNKRKAITLTGGSSGAQTDYQLKLTIPYDSDMQTDFADIRFTDSNGVTLVDAWLESKIDSVTADIWVKFPATPADGVEQIYYMYYGNSIASSDWNITDTFIFGDDFEGGNLDKWNKPDGTPSIVSNPDGDGNVLELLDVGAKDEVNSITTLVKPYVLDYKVRIHNPTDAGALGVSTAPWAGGNYQIMNPGYPASGNWGYKTVTGSWTNTGHAFSIDTWYDISHVRESLSFTVYEDGVKIIDAVGDSNNQTFIIFGTGTGDQIWVDDVRVRKYVTNPATHAIGSEEFTEVPVYAVEQYNYQENTPTAADIVTAMEAVGTKLTGVKDQTDKMNFTGDDIKATLDGEKVSLTDATEAQIDDVEDILYNKTKLTNISHTEYKEEVYEDNGTTVKQEFEIKKLGNTEIRTPIP